MCGEVVGTGNASVEMGSVSVSRVLASATDCGDYNRTEKQTGRTSAMDVLLDVTSNE